MIALQAHIKNYIDGHLAEKLSIETIAHELQISGTTLRRQFQLYYGVTIYQYILKLRMEVALIKFKEAKYTVAEVGRMVGYLDQAHFSNVFYKYHGKRPSEIIIETNTMRT